MPTITAKPESPIKVKRDPILTLSTRVEACDVIEVDGDEYDVLGFKHLSDEGETEVMATLARYDNLSVKLVTTNDDREAVTLAKKMRAKRIQLLTSLTTLPVDVAEALPPTEQMKLLRAVQRVAGLADDDADGESES